MKKPAKYEKKIEIDPIEIFKKVAQKSTKFKVDYANQIHLEYLKRRKGLVNAIESFCVSQNSGQETFFQAVFYLDKIIFQGKLTEFLDKINNNNNNINDKYFCNNNELNFFSKLIKKENCEFNNSNQCETILKNLVEFDYLFVSLALGCFCISSKLYIKFYLHKLIFFFTLTKLNKLNFLF